ncbi:diguanylate cyclase [Demequina sp. NBRC 110054]|uniref:GGDEF domain-containing protein n=1 Tax=Demequina sp. NBRC 110054 TaxID=1570343 RepID=UPI000A058145|nr:GGDEF domain-containing protein [Demequina sp. NBRC 110054]
MAEPVLPWVQGQENYLGQVARAVTIVLGLVAVVDVFYAVMVTSLWRDVLWGLLVMDFLGIVGALGSIAMVRRGHVLFGSIAIFVLAIVQIVVSAWVLGWQSGVHLFLIAGGALAVLVFTDRQRALRWGFGVLSVGVFVFCQFALPDQVDRFGVTPEQRSVLFTANAIFTALATTIVSLATHTRASTAWRAVAASSARSEHLANTDELTGLPNRRPILELLDSLSAPGAGAYCVAVADLDHFKRINDTFGHSCGDVVLSVVGHRLREHLRAGDMIGRWGGEEFVFVMPLTSLDDAAQVMERARGRGGPRDTLLGAFARGADVYRPGGWPGR